LGLTKFKVKKCFDPKKFRAKQFFWVKKILGKKNEVKNFWAKKIIGSKKKFSKKILGPKKCWSQKNVR
jgi:hypothetical protein